MYVGIPAIGLLAATWVKGRYGRKVRLKIGELEAEGRSVKEVEDMLRMAAEYQAGRPETKD